MVTHIKERQEARLKGAIIASFAVGVVLLAVKFAAYAITGSAAILSDATESIINVITAAFAFYSLTVAGRPPDECHPYGHGKIEFFSAAFEGGAIIVVAIWIAYKAIHELITGPVLHQMNLGIWLVAVAMVINAILGVYLVRFGKMTGSIILTADGKHLLTDVATSAGVVVGLVVMVFTGWLFLDSLIALAVAVGIVITGWRLLRTAGSGMMDRASPEDEAVIKGILENPQFREVCGYHKLRLRHSGMLHFVDFHLAFPRNMAINQAHAIATAIEARVAEALGDAGVMAHIEPCRKNDCPRCSEQKPKE